MEIKRMVESIVRELVAKLEAETVQPPKVLYVLDDGAAHEAYTDHFILLQNHGIRHDILFLDGEASAWLGKHKVETGGPGKVIAADEFAPAPIEVPMAYDGIVVPEIDLDNAGRVSLGMKGTVKSEIIFAALVLGKFVLVGEDIPGLKRADRRTLKTLELPAAYGKLFDYYKMEMQTYGIEFAPLKRLAEQVVRKLPAARKQTAAASADGSSEISADARRGEAGGAAGSVTFEGKLLSADWVRQQLKSREFTRLTLGQGTILSPLAKDLLREKGIAVNAEER
ncbi:hypothetical protein [Paenibacillus darwinianus]|nr:hypothetical protein [Paenibacillus darwinianus]EXX87791.1 hypothetical protein BG52_03295 [Paenibacillus darwinianus]EXX89044.1 hypothetical protein CH50_02295 [Paenibacillus darwinianus]